MENEIHDSAYPISPSPLRVSPMEVPNFHPYSPIFHPYSSSSSNFPYQLKREPHSPNQAIVISQPVLVMPMRVQEDVIIMDAITVKEPRSAGSVGSFHGGRSNSGSSPSGGSGSVNSKYKPAICRYGDKCRNGPDCKFTHSSDELRPPRFSNKNNLKIPKPTFNSPGGSISSSPYRANSRSVTPVKISSPLVPRATTSIQVKLTSDESPKTADVAICDWSPEDDGISATLPGFGSTEEEIRSSRADVDEYINSLLYGIRSRKRLPVFEEIYSLKN